MKINTIQFIEETLEKLVGQDHIDHESFSRAQQLNEFETVANDEFFAGKNKLPVGRVPWDVFKELLTDRAALAYVNGKIAIKINEIPYISQVSKSQVIREVKRSLTRHHQQKFPTVVSLEPETEVTYFVECMYCQQPYNMTATPATSQDWRELQERVAKPYGWCGKCSQYNCDG